MQVCNEGGHFLIPLIALSLFPNREKEIIKVEKSCISSCKPPCQKMVYKVDIGEGVWPDKRQVMSVYEGLIFNKTSHKYYPEYEKIYKDWSKTRSANALPMGEDKLEKNLILVRKLHKL